MDIHPSQIPVSRTFDVSDYSETFIVIREILATNFSNEAGFKVLMPKDRNLARRIGYTMVNELNKGLRLQNYTGNVRYFVYHHDQAHYAIVFVSEESLRKLHS
ncbi:MAG: hypothetical protein QXU32_08505 [Nitrososphaerales archaeon]